MSKHTPGPWRVVSDDEDDSPRYIERADGLSSVACDCRNCSKGEGNARVYSEIVTCDSHVYGPTRQDARLIAAAPEMYALLRESQNNIGGDWRARRDALLAKIDG